MPANNLWPNFEHVRPELLAVEPQYEVVRDCIERLVKKKGLRYLPMPNPDDETESDTQKIARYNSYLTRANFYDVTGRTLNGLVGQVFTNDPEIVIPASLEKMKEDVSGRGVTLIQSSKESVEQTLAYGRIGLYIDYPQLEVSATRQEIEEGIVKPSISIYSSDSIINWGHSLINRRNVLSLVVLKETGYIQIDPFKQEEAEQYRALMLEPNGDKYIYRVHLWSKAETGDWKYSVNTPLDFNGEPFEEIQFEFVGATNNDPLPDQAPLYPLAELNVGHYRNSADHEEMTFIVGQPTIVATGITEEWLRKVLKGVIRMGSRGGIPLPRDADAKILQVSPNTLAFEAMQHKEKQMVAIGAKLVEDRKVERTATEANIYNASESSLLATVAKNVGEGYRRALIKAQRFVGPATEEIIFKLNTDFAITRMTAPERQQVVAEWVAGAISFTEMRTAMRSSGIATEDDATVKAEAEAEAKKRADQEVEKATAIAAAKPAPAVGKQSSGA